MDDTCRWYVQCIHVTVCELNDEPLESDFISYTELTFLQRRSHCSYSLALVKDRKMTFSPFCVDVNLRHWSWPFSFTSSTEPFTSWKTAGSSLWDRSAVHTSTNMNSISNCVFAACFNYKYVLVSMPWPLSSSAGLHCGPSCRLETKAWRSQTIVAENAGDRPASTESWPGVSKATLGGQSGMAVTRGNGNVNLDKHHKRTGKTVSHNKVPDSVTIC